MRFLTLGGILLNLDSVQMIIRSVNSKREVKLKFYLNHKLDLERSDILKSLGFDVDFVTHDSFCISQDKEMYNELDQQLIDNDLKFSIVNVK